MKSTNGKASVWVLLVEDDEDLAKLIQEELEAQAWEVSHCQSLAAAQHYLEAISQGEQPSPHLLITDLRLPDGHGMSLVERVVASFPEGEGPGILVITAFGSVSQAVEALKAGADDFLTKPLDLDHFLIAARKILETRQLKDELMRFRQLTQDPGFHGLYGKSTAMQKLLADIRLIARATGPVLINGESGTGKELVARAIHNESERSEGPFLAVNCAGIPQDLLESEFFGHASGAFTGAGKARKGLLQEADGGTLLLDEIGEMPLSLQAKLLRALQDGSIRPVGQDREEQVDVRIIAATHRNLKQKVDQGEFREDLYYRLETFSLDVPPLREREEDLALLAQHFLKQHALAQGKALKGFSEAAMQSLVNYPFPGNVRELQNVVERAVTFCTGDLINPEHLPERIILDDQFKNASLDEASTNPLSFSEALPTLDKLQNDYVHHIMEQVGGNKKRAAEILGIGRRTLYRWLEEEN